MTTREKSFQTGAYAVVLALVWVSRGATGAETATEPIAIKLRVVHAETQAPLPGAEIKVYSGKSPAPHQTGTTAGDGGIAIRISAAADGPIAVTAAKRGFTPLKLSSDPTAMPTEFTFALAPSRTVGGVVRDESGKPIPDVAVTLRFPQRLGGPRVPVEDFPIRTDSQGRWRAEFVPAGADYIRVELKHPDFEPQEIPDAGESLVAKLQSESAELQMKSVLALQGRVLDTEGRPIQGARVTRGQEWGIMGLEEGATVETDADGKFQFPKLAAAKMLVAAEASGFAPDLQSTDLKPGAKPLEFKLGSPKTIRGQVLDNAGRPLPGVQVRADEWRQFRYPDWKTKTDAEGRFVISNAPPDEVKFDFSKAGYMSVRMFGLPPSGADHRVILGPTLRLHGKVVDAESGQPVLAFKLIPGWPRQVFGRDGKSSSQGGEWARYNVKQLSDGEYDITFDEPIVHGTRTPYDYMLRIEADGYAPAISPVFKHDALEATHDFHLQKSTGLKGVVRLPDQSPVSGAEVIFTTRQWDARIRNGRTERRPDIESIRTDPNGQFTIPTPTESTFILVIHELGMAELNDERLRSSPQIALQRWGRIEGTLKVGNRTGVREQVALWFSERWEEGDNFVRPKQQAFRQYDTRTDDEGRFVFERVPPGDVSIARVVNPKRPMGVASGMWEVWGACKLANLRVKDGETVRIVVGGDGRPIVGRIVIPEGLKEPVDWSQGDFKLWPVLPQIPVPGNLPQTEKQAWIDQWYWSDASKPFRPWIGGTPQASGRGPVRSDLHGWAIKVESDGSFRIDDAPPGAYQLRLQLRKPFQPRVSPYMPENEIASLWHTFVVLESAGGPSEQPLDLGALELQPAEISLDLAEPTTDKPVSLGAGLSSKKLRPGQTFTFYVKARIFPGHHIYAMRNPSEKFTPTSLDLMLPSSVTLGGDWTAPPIRGRPDKTMSYVGDGWFRRYLKLADGAKPGPIKIACVFQYQVCNEEVCWPPAKMALEANAEIVGSQK